MAKSMPENNKVQKYTKPLIKEAVFDWQIRGDSFNESLFDEFLKRSGNYTSHGNLQNINIDANTMAQNIDIVGYKGISPDKKQIILFKKYGFSFSRLEVYNGWEKNYKEALRLWNIYCEIMNPQAITRVATRFINRFQIPGIFTKASVYFNTHIQYDNNISPAWNQMSYRLLLSHDNGIKSHIVFDNNVNQSIQSVDVVLDIDVFSDSSLKANASVLENIFSQLRKIKNEIFEKSITDKIRELIK